MFVKGDIVECVDNTSCSECLTIGKTYVVECDSANGNLIKIIHNQGIVGGFYSYRLKKVVSMSQLVIQVDSVNKEFHDLILNHLRTKGLTVSGGFGNGFYRFINIQGINVNGNPLPKKDEKVKNISINELLQMEFEVPLKVSGHVVTKTNSGIKVGCTEISMDDVEKIYKLAKS